MIMTSSLLIVCTNDLHSCADQYESLRNTALNEQRKRGQPPILMLDAGDWFSGTVYSWPSPQSSNQTCVELEYFLENNVIANLGNHEFDATVDGLAVMLNKASKRGYHKLVCSNIRIEKTCSIYPFYSNNLSAPNVLNECVIEEINGFGKVGILGLMGDDAAFGCQANTKGQGLSFRRLSRAMTKCSSLVKRLRSQEGCVGVILLFHGGKEELDIVAAHSLFDFVVCAHTHEVYAASCDQRMSQAGAYGLCLGVHELALTNSKTIRLVQSDLVKVAPCSIPHPAYVKSVRPLLAELSVPDVLVSPSQLPLEALIPIQRSVHCSFATWVCDGLLNEISTIFQQPVDGFFVAHELIRGDLSAQKTVGISISNVASVLECGQSSAAEIGVEIHLIETTPFQLLFLHSAFVIGNTFITNNALPIYSSSFFAACKSPTALLGGKKLKIATTKFMADSLKLIPRIFFDSSNVIDVRKASLSVLLFKHIVNISSQSKL